ncbi:putative nuclease HARBI1 [Heptranchias perlo]|uniref:putative nuclease HARBI1 n=1 Tax=Heptranchias perlo TaxID=212740 RepID=UPI0035594531
MYIKDQENSKEKRCGEQQRVKQPKGLGLRRHYPYERVYRQRLSSLDLSEEQCPCRLRLSRHMVTDICSLLEEELLPAGPGGHALPIAIKITTALNFFASASFQCTTGDISRVCQWSAHKCIWQVIDVLFARVSIYLNFPCNDNSQNERAVSFTSLAGFPQVQDANDCTHVAIRGPPHESKVFINFKGFLSIDAQPVCNHKKRFMQVCARFPGSYYDAFIERQSNISDLFQTGDRLRAGSLETRDTSLQTWLMTPVRNPTNETQECDNQSHMTTRCVTEQAIGMLKMCFRCLAMSGGPLESRQRLC